MGGRWRFPRDVLNAGEAERGLAVPGFTDPMHAAARLAPPPKTPVELEPTADDLHAAVDHEAAEDP